jgi:hypothetical protein
MASQVRFASIFFGPLRPSAFLLQDSDSKIQLPRRRWNIPRRFTTQLCSHEIYSGSKTKGAQHFPEILPSQAKGPNIREPQPSHNFQQLCVLEFFLSNRVF